MTTITEADVEEAALGWGMEQGPDIAPDTATPCVPGRHSLM